MQDYDYSEVELRLAELELQIRTNAKAEGATLEEVEEYLDEIYEKAIEELIEGFACEVVVGRATEESWALMKETGMQYPYILMISVYADAIMNQYRNVYGEEGFRDVVSFLSNFGKIISDEVFFEELMGNGVHVYNKWVEKELLEDEIDDETFNEPTPALTIQCGVNIYV